MSPDFRKFYCTTCVSEDFALMLGTKTLFGLVCSLSLSFHKNWHSGRSTTEVKQQGASFLLGWVTI